MGDLGPDIFREAVTRQNVAIYGAPGCGKTRLANFIVDAMRADNVYQAYAEWTPAFVAEESMPNPDVATLIIVDGVSSSATSEMWTRMETAAEQGNVWFLLVCQNGTVTLSAKFENMVEVRFIHDGHDQWNLSIPCYF